MPKAPGPLSPWRRLRALGALLVLLPAGGPGTGSVPAPSLTPLRLEHTPGPGGPARGVFSERTIAVAVELDRDGARLLRYTAKDRPFTRALLAPPPHPYRRGQRVPLEVVLEGPGGARYRQEISVGRICLDHDAAEEPHISGDTILLHRDTFVLEVPERAGFDRLSIAYFREEASGLVRRHLATERLDAARFTAAGSDVGYGSLAFAGGEDSLEGSEATETTGTVLWPADFGETETYRTYGDPAETSRRINVTIVPDGYTHFEKATMEAHAEAMVNYFRTKTPYAEHDPFMNYHLVYAYSLGSGTDQCDCGIIIDTAMGTRFPQAVPTCGHSDNRCLYYGSGCDTNSSGNIALAELRAPATDTTIVMVNTSRYGGCGGARAVYSAANASALEVAVHELGHSLGDLDDEYQGNAGCGTSAGEINTSTNPATGAWPEWIGDIGAPREGARYWDQCIYRPEANCEMRALNQPFCRVCRQQWSLVTFGHFRVNPTAPIEDRSPASPLGAFTYDPVDFSVATRLSVGLAGNSITWTMEGPGYAGPTVVATGSPDYSHLFTQAGMYTLTCEVVADTNFVKPVKYGINVDTVVWSIDVVDGTVDNDGDGFAPNQGDCNDLDPTVFPGAPQLCDGKNNDCGAPGWPAVPASETDDDRDAYSECAGDCDDGAPLVNPGAPEIGCDGIDNDCDPITQDIADSDGDGYLCDVDCDDADPAVRPGAVEANDGVDNQCPGDPGHGLVDEIPGPAEFSDPLDALNLCWPAQPGAQLYEVLRSVGTGFQDGCQRFPIATTCWSDPQNPAPGDVQMYLVRSLREHAGSAGRDGAGAERRVLCAAEMACDDGLDNDADGAFDCADADCLAGVGCPTVEFSFLDTPGDDIADTDLEGFLAGAPVLPDDHIHVSITGQIGLVYEWCSSRPDWYRDRYLSLAPFAGTDYTGNWDRWYADPLQSWTGPFTGTYQNSFGWECGGPYSWCSEIGLGPGAIAVAPGDTAQCESAELASGCGTGDWIFSVRFGVTRLSTCGF